MTKHYNNPRLKRKARIRAKISGTAKRPRVSVFRSNRALYVQLVDDEKRVTLVGVGEVHLTSEKNNLARAKALGKLLAESAKKRHISRVVFDRGGYAYHGRVKALAEGLREGGLAF